MIVTIMVVVLSARYAVDSLENTVQTRRNPLMNRRLFNLTLLCKVGAVSILNLFTAKEEKEESKFDPGIDSKEFIEGVCKNLTENGPNFVCNWPLQGLPITGTSDYFKRVKVDGFYEPKNIVEDQNFTRVPWDGNLVDLRGKLVVRCRFKSCLIIIDKDTRFAFCRFEAVSVRDTSKNGRFCMFIDSPFYNDGILRLVENSI